MNCLTLNDLARSRPPEALLEKEIQMRAYELYQQRGEGQGFALQDWLQAESEVLDRLSNSVPRTIGVDAQS
jgi:hypothetical protein